MKYVYKCNKHGEFIVEQPMTARHEEALCFCNVMSPRVWEPTQHVWEYYAHPHHRERRGSEG